MSLVETLHGSLAALSASDVDTDGVPVSLAESISQTLHAIRDIVTSTEVARTAIAEQFQAMGTFQALISVLPYLLPEGRKDVAAIFSAVLAGNLANFVEYLAAHLTSILVSLVSGYSNNDIALTCGAMLRECAQHEAVCAQMLASPEVLWPFFDTYAHTQQFDIASDAFMTIKEVITCPQCKHLSKEFLTEHCDLFLSKYEALLQSDNYMTKRKALKLLTELLLDRTYNKMMMRYISSKEHLKTIMNMLKAKSVQIQYESFHVFKIFIANPHKSPEVSSVLYNNKEKMIGFLQTFQADRDDALFKDEKAHAIEVLNQLSNPDSKLRKYRSAGSIEIPSSEHPPVPAHAHSHSDTTSNPAPDAALPPPPHP